MFGSISKFQFHSNFTPHHVAIDPIPDWFSNNLFTGWDQKANLILILCLGLANAYLWKQHQ